MFEAQFIKKLRQTESEFKKAVAYKKKRVTNFLSAIFLKGLLKGNTGQNYKYFGYSTKCNFYCEDVNNIYEENEEREQFYF